MSHSFSINTNPNPVIKTETGDSGDELYSYEEGLSNDEQVTGFEPLFKLPSAITVKRTLEDLTSKLMLTEATLLN